MEVPASWALSIPGGLRCLVGSAVRCFTSRRDPYELTERARASFDSRFRHQALEEARQRGEELEEPEIERRADHLRRAHFARLALRSVDARKRAKQQRERQRGQPDTTGD
jgi:hypothetical protein